MVARDVVPEGDHGPGKGSYARLGVPSVRTPRPCATCRPRAPAEGLARDVVRAVQQARREAGLQVSDRIDLTLGADQTVRAAVEAHTKLIKTETLAATLDITDAQALPGLLVSVGDKQSVRVALTVADPQPGL